jgi:hypothetical protein
MKHIQLPILMLLMKILIMLEVKENIEMQRMKMKMKKLEGEDKLDAIINRNKINKSQLSFIFNI